MKTKNFFKKLLVIACIGFMPLAAICQDEDEPPEFTDPDPDGQTEVPIDGGLSVLIAAGVAYGIKKVYNQNRKPTQEV